LIVRLVDFRLDARIFGVALDIGYHADDFTPRRRCAGNINLNLFPERVLILKVLVDKLVI
jgi:hypothetical protein